MFTTGLKKLGAILISAALIFGLSACSAEDDNTITLGFLPSWTDGLSTAYLLKDRLEAMGYNVEMQELNDAGPLYAGLAQGDIDIFSSAWPEVTHASYMEEYGDQLEDLGTYYDDAQLNWAVPEYSEITSIDQIPQYADQIGNRIIGIEPGAGLTKVSQESVIPAYGLEGLELTTSSTTAMLTELESAIAEEREIVVTLWTPFWAMGEYPVRALEDPQGALGEPEGLHFMGTQGFSEKYPDAAELIGNIHMTQDEYSTFEGMVVNDFGEGRYEEAIDAWTEQYPDLVPVPENQGGQG